MDDLKHIREQKNLTQDDLASLSGLAQSHIASIETGQYLPQLKTRTKIEQLLGTEVNWLTTLAQDRGNIGYALNQLINAEAPGVEDRIKFVKQYLNELSNMMKTIEERDDNDDILMQPGRVPSPMDSDEAHAVLFPTSPFNPQPDTDDDSPLLPPLLDK